MVKPQSPLCLPGSERAMEIPTFDHPGHSVKNYKCTRCYERKLPLKNIGHMDDVQQNNDVTQWIHDVTIASLWNYCKGNCSKISFDPFSILAIVLLTEGKKLI